MTNNTALEERIAHLIRAVDDLSDIVAAQGREMDRLTRLTEMLALREAQREDTGLEPPSANVPPPALVILPGDALYAGGIRATLPL